jgi:predicted transcriptional regulator
MMELNKVMEILEAEVLSGNNTRKIEIKDCAASDLMSDVLNRQNTPDLLITGLCNPQAVRTASLFGVKAVVIVRGKRVDDAIIKLAQDEDIVLLATKLNCFESCGRLYQQGLRGMPVQGGNK